MEGRIFKDLFSKQNEELTDSTAAKPVGFSNVIAKPHPLRPLTLLVPLSPAADSENTKVVDEVYSPVTSLAINLSDKLHTDSSYDGTPKRKLASLFNPGTNYASYDSTAAEVASITYNARSIFESVLDNASVDTATSPIGDKQNETRTTRRIKTGFRRIKSMTADATSPLSGSPKHQGKWPVPRSPLCEVARPSLEEDNSQDSGLGCDKDKASLDDFRFATPVGIPPRRYRQDSNSPLRYSPVSAGDFSPQCLFPRGRALSPSFTESAAVSLMKSPIQRSKSSESTGTGNDSDDDGFLELIDFDDDDVTTQCPSGLSSLLTAPLVTQRRTQPCSANDKENTPTPKRGAPRGLFRSPSAPRLGVHKSISGSPVESPFSLFSRPLPSPVNSNKRSSPPIDDNTPVISKRRKSVADDTRGHKENTKPRTATKFQRSISDSETQIKHALSRADQADLIGDFSRSYCLPTIPGKHQDLRSITPQTMADLIDKNYDHIVGDFIVVDCRYPYEYDGGHIKGARNLWNKDEIIRELILKPRTCANTDKRFIVIFHCEFSSERGPALSRFLRSQDRLRNNETYPNLHYPELYLLEGGYKAFYAQFPAYNYPAEYMPMLHADHSKDLRHFRAKSKSWAGEKGRVRTGLKF